MHRVDKLIKQLYSNSPTVSQVNSNINQTSNIYGIIEGNDSFKWTDKSHSILLNELNYGAYTGLRTINKYNLFQFKMHIQRLIITVNQHENNTNNIKIPNSILTEFLTTQIQTGLHEFYKRFTLTTDETRIFIYIDSGKLFNSLINDNNSDISECLSANTYIHSCKLPQVNRPINICIKIGRHKFETQRKSTKWF
eukprot:489001_1